MTCALVTTWPCASTMKPEPSACCFITSSAPPPPPPLSLPWPPKGLSSLPPPNGDWPWPCGIMRNRSPKPRNCMPPWPTLTSWMVVMFTTAGFTLATRVATSGVPVSTGGVEKGAGVWARPSPPAAEAACWQPVPRARARATATGDTGRSFRKVMSPWRTTGAAGDSRPHPPSWPIRNGRVPVEPVQDADGLVAGAACFALQAAPVFHARPVRRSSTPRRSSRLPPGRVRSERPAMQAAAQTSPV